MWELEYKVIWVPKYQCFLTVMLKKTLESTLDCKKIKPVHSKGDQSWIFIGRTEAELEIPIILPPDAKNWLIGKFPDPGKDWRLEEKRPTEGEIVGWHHWHNGPDFLYALQRWWTGKPGVLHSMSSQRVAHDWVTELNWTAKILTI